MVLLMAKLQGEKTPKPLSNNEQAVDQNQKLTWGGGSGVAGGGGGDGGRGSEGRGRMWVGGMWGGVQARWVMGDIMGRGALTWGRERDG